MGSYTVYENKSEEGISLSYVLASVYNDIPDTYRKVNQAYRVFSGKANETMLGGLINLGLVNSIPAKSLDIFTLFLWRLWPCETAK